MFQVLYKHKIIVFGGFYDTLREVRLVDSIINHMNYLLRIASELGVCVCVCMLILRLKVHLLFLLRFKVTLYSLSVFCLLPHGYMYFL